MNDSTRIQTRLATISWLGCLAVLLMPMLLSGCARFRLPRIDPTGNSILLPAPNSTRFLLPGSTPGTQAPDNLPPQPPPGLLQPVPGPAPAATVQPMPTPTAISPVRPAAPGNATIEPAFAAPPVPPPCNQGFIEKKKHLIPDPNRRLTPGQAGQLVMTPSRIVAPVGSEVVVLAGVCGPEGRFLKNQPLEWMLSNDSVGEFIEVGGTHHGLFNQLIPPTARKQDGQFAEGRTGLKRVVLSRGTPTPLDDIELKQGQTFVSVASASPGTSFVTGVAPDAEGWDRRRAITTIHWVDANWSIPVPIQSTAGTVTPLTTVISRTDGSGVGDWTVRYSIVGGAPAEFEPSGSRTAEAKTNRDGQATVQIRQPAGEFEPGTTQVRVDIVRPPIFGQPELIVESGITSVTWSAPALTIRAIGPRTVEQDTAFNYRVEISNPGDQIARNVVVRTKDLDDSLDYISSSPKSTQYGRQYEWQLGDIAPNAAAQAIDVQLRSDKLGNVGLCFEVISETDGLQTEACAQTEVITPCIGLTVTGPETARVGELVAWDIQVANRCEQVLQNVEMLIEYDPGLVRTGKPNPTLIRIQPDGILQVQDAASFPFEAIAQAPGQQCFVVTITADGIRPERQRVCIDVQAAGTTPNPTPQPGTNPLRVETFAQAPVTYQPNPDQGQFDVETRTPVQVRVTNNSRQLVENATLQLRPSAALELGLIDQNIQVSVSGREYFAGLPVIEPGQTLTVNTEFIGLQDDPNATLGVSVSTPNGQGATDSIRVQAATPAGAGANGPDFSQPAIGIPVDGQPEATAPRSVPGGVVPGVGNPGEPLAVNVAATSSQVRAGQQGEFTFSITNVSTRPLRNVQVKLLLPNTLAFGETERFFNSDALQPQAGPTLPRIDPLPAGKTNTSRIQLRAANLPGPATFEVQVTSDDFTGVISDYVTVQIVL